MDVPLAVVYALSPLLEHERVPVPGAVMSGLMRLLPSTVIGPRLLKDATVSAPVLSATVSEPSVLSEAKSGRVSPSRS